MTRSKAKEVAGELSRLAGVFLVRAIYEYGRGAYGLMVASEMTTGPVMLVDEEHVVLWRHNYNYWRQKKESGDGTAQEDHGEA